MDETGHWNILFLGPQSIFSQLLLRCEQAVCLSFTCNLKPLLGLGLQRICRLVACNAGIVRTTGKLLPLLTVFIKLLFIKVFVVALSLLTGFTCLLVFLGCHGKLLGRNLIFRHFDGTMEAKAVTMGKEQMLIVITVPISIEHRRNIWCGEALGEQLRVNDVVVIGDTTIFGHFLVIGRHQKMRLILVAKIRTIHRIVEM